MITAILADDEEIIRDSMARWMPWKELGIRLVGVASDGEEAFDLICTNHPDIVITDIRMPKLDGLELIKKVHKKLPDIEFIIISGFGEFSYAQTAMSYGVRHYLLKPIRKEELTKILLAVKKKIEDRDIAKYDGLFDSKEKYTFYLQRGMMMEVLSDSSSVDSIIERSRRLAAFDSDELLSMFVISILEPDRFVSLILPAIKATSIRMPIFPVSIKDKVYITLDVKSLSGLNDVVNEISSRRGTLVDIVKGTPAEIVKRFVSDASSVDEASIYDGEGHRETVHILPRVNNEEETLVTRYREVLAGGADPSLMDDVERIFRSKELDAAEALLVLMAMRSTDYVLLFKELGEVRNTDDLISVARSFIDHKVPHEKDPFPVETMRRYINTHFSNPEISLKWISENVVYMNPEYLSRLFQKEMGQRFTDYLNTTRVNESMKLMSIYHESTISEIAEKVGYSNPGYFFHIFRRYTGMTPGEYMEKSRRGRVIDE